MFISISGCVSERENQGLYEYQQAKCVTNFENVQISLKATSKFNFPGLLLPGMLLPGDPGGVNWYKQRFWTPADICDLGQQGDLKKKNNSENTKVLKISELWHGFKISPILADLCHICTPKCLVPWIWECWIWFCWIQDCWKLDCWNGVLLNWRIVQFKQCWEHYCCVRDFSMRECWTWHTLSVDSE